MQRLFFPALGLLTLLVAGCSDSPSAAPPPPVPELETALLGTWETVELDVSYATYLAGDTSFQERITEAEWGQKYGVRPPSTRFTADGKLLRTHRLTDGQVANITHGIWKAQGDSLLVIEPNVTYTYLPDLNGDRLVLTGLTDQDQDGKRDDQYRAVLRQVSRSR
jgi:hypothetical protein